MDKQITRRGMIKASLAAAATGTLGPASIAARAAPPDRAANVYDAVILGAGTAGLVTAVEACDQGIKPVVLEKMDLPSGNSIFALGSVNACGTRMQREAGITDTEDALFAAMMDIAAGQADPALTRTYVQHSAGIAVAVKQFTDRGWGPTLVSSARTKPPDRQWSVSYVRRTTIVWSSEAACACRPAISSAQFHRKRSQFRTLITPLLVAPAPRGGR